MLYCEYSWYIFSGNRSIFVLPIFFLSVLCRFLNDYCDSQIEWTLGCTIHCRKDKAFLLQGMERNDYMRSSDNLSISSEMRCYLCAFEGAAAGYQVAETFLRTPYNQISSQPNGHIRDVSVGMKFIWDLCFRTENEQMHQCRLPG